MMSVSLGINNIGSNCPGISGTVPDFCLGTEVPRHSAGSVRTYGGTYVGTFVCSIVFIAMLCHFAHAQGNSHCLECGLLV